VITLFRPESLVIFVHIDHTSCTGNNSIILVTETVALLEHSVGLHISVCIIR